MELFSTWLAPFLVAVTLLWGLGLSLGRWLIPPFLRVDRVLLAPFLGFAAVSSICIYLGTLGIPVERFAWVLLILAALGLIWARRQLWLGVRHHWRVLAIIVLTYALAMLPLIKLGYLTTIGGTIDAISYAVRSEYLQAAGLVKPAASVGQPFYDWVAAHIDFLRVGDVYFVSLVGTVTGARSYQLLTMLAALFFGLTPVAVFVFSRRTLQLKQPAALLAAALAGVHNFLLWPVYDNFLSQAMAVSMFLVVLSFGLLAIHTRGWRESIGFAALLAALTSVYPVYALPVVAIGLLYGMVQIAQQVRRHTAPVISVIKGYAFWGIGLLGLVFIWNGPAIWRAYKEMSYIGTLMGPDATKVVGPGNIMTFVPLSVMTGLGAHVNVAHDSSVWQLPIWLLWIGIGVTLGGMGLGWLRLARGARWAAAVTLAVVVGLAVQQRFLINQPDGYPYGYFKIASLMVLTGLPLFAQGVYSLIKRPHLRYVAVVMTVAVVGINLVNSLSTIGYVVVNNVVINRALIETAQGVSAAPEGNWIQLDLRPGLAQNWIAYLLKDRRVHFREKPLLWSWVIGEVDPSTVYNYSLVETMSDTAHTSRSLLDEPWYDPAGYNVAWQNDVYQLRQRRDNTVADFPIQAGQEDWLPDEALNITADTQAGHLLIQAGDRHMGNGALVSAPSTIELIVVLMGPSAEIRVGETSLHLLQGVWKVKAALNETGQIALQNAGSSPLYLYRVRAYGDDVPESTSPTEAEPQPEGVAIVWQSLEEKHLRYRTTLLRPLGDPSVYRLSLYVVDLNTQRLFGAWGLDFSRPDRLQQGELNLDLSSRAAQGIVNGVEAPVDVGPQNVKHGDFESQVVWWRMAEQPINLALCHCARFSRQPGAQIEFKAVAKRAPLVIIPPP